tara:strand:- start:963 stop:1859 length:897 start_codon:yes stop_codon:yes gene_type:complete
MLKSVNEKQWVDFLGKSQNPTIYHHPAFLRVFKDKVDFKCFFKGDELVMGIPLIANKTERLRFQAYNGFIFLDRKKTKLQKIISTNAKGFVEYADYFYKNYNKLKLSCDGTQTDARQFIWHKYPNSKFFTEEYYTSKIFLKNFSREAISEARRQDLKKSEILGLCVKESSDYNSAASFFYGADFDNSLVDDKKIYFEIMKSLTREKLGKLYCSCIKEKIVSYAFFGLIKDKVFYMFSGRDKNFKEVSNHTLLIYESLVSFQSNFSEFDFVGVNSPNRGSYKLSFGGNLERGLYLGLNK